MSEQQFQILVNGTLTEGAQLADVKQKIVQLFKTTADKVEPMFSGRALVVKKNLDPETAQKYKTAITRAGLVAKIAPMAGESQPDTDKTASGLDNVGLAAVGGIIDDTPVPAMPDINTGDLVIGPAGEQLVETVVVPNADIDTSQLSMGTLGEDVVEATSVDVPDIDISSLSMGSVGEDVTEHVVVPDAEIDTSALSMSEAGADVTEHEEVPPANIDTSRLQLDETTK